MAKKGKKDKAGAKSADKDSGASDERTLLYEKAKALKKELENEQAQFNEFQQQREKLNYFWIVENKNLKDREALLRDKTRQLQDLEEKQSVELKVYKERVKHLLSEQQSEYSEHKHGNKSSLRILQESSQAEIRQGKEDVRALKIALKESETSHLDYLKGLKEEQDKKISELRANVERKARQLSQKFERRSRTLREQLETQRKAEIQRLEYKKDDHISELMKKHEKAFAEIKNYYNDITHNNLDLIKSLKEEVAEKKKKESADEKLMSEIAQENKRMSEPLKQALRDVENLRKKLAAYKITREKLKSEKDEVAVLEEKLNSLDWEHEVLLQRFGLVEEERQELYDNFQSALAEVQQKAGFKHLLLEKKLEVAEEKAADQPEKHPNQG